MERRRRVGVTAHAQIGGRWCEPAIAVAVRARDLADVGRVSRPVVHVAIRDRHLLGNPVRARSARRGGGDGEEHEPAHHSALPTG